MSIKTITAYLDSVETANQVIASATDLAVHFDSHLVGLCIKPDVSTPIAMSDPMGTAWIASYYDQINKAELKKIRSSFKELTKERSVVAEWREIDAVYSIKDNVAQHAQMSDLMVVGTDQEPHTLSRIGSLISSTQRPTMVVPPGQTMPLVGSSILVAWDGSPESTRAVFGSLPLLQAAQKVHLVMVNPDMYDQHHLLGSDTEFTNALARHNVNVELSFSTSNNSDIAEEILRIAREKGVSAIVMGAFGTGRLHNLLVGSVSQKTLQQTQIPLLMSH